MDTVTIKRLINDPKEIDRTLAEIDRKADIITAKTFPIQLVNERLALWTDTAGQNPERKITLSFNELLDLSNALYVYLKKRKLAI